MDIQCLENTVKQSLLVKISGDCDMYSAQEFFLSVMEKINSGFASIYLDFSGVVYLDSSGVGAIIKILKQSKEKNVDLKFRGISGTPRKVLRMSNILTLIKEEA
jgi:anti-anti-sigma factor